MREAVRTPRARAIICGVVAALVSLAVVQAVAAHGGVDVLVRLPKEETIGRWVAERDPDFQFVPRGTAYDGRYFYTVALDPFAKGEPSHLLDHAAYRYGHAGSGWVTGVIALGRQEWVPWALIIVSVIGMTLATSFSSLLATGIGVSGWAALLLVVNPGLLFAVSTDTSEPLGAAVLVLGLMLWWKGRLLSAAALFVVLCLIKEPFVLVPAGLFLWELIDWLRSRDRTGLWKRLALLTAGPIALGAWYLYLKSEFDIWPFADNPENVGWPIVGWIDSVSKAVEQSIVPELSQTGSVSVALLISIGVALLIGAVRAVRLRSPVDVIYLLTVVLLSLLTQYALLAPKDLFRNVWMALALLPWVLWVDADAYKRLRDTP